MLLAPGLGPVGLVEVGVAGVAVGGQVDLGEDLLRALVDGLPQRRVLLATPEGTSRAWKLYRRLGFTDVLRDYRFAGDPRPFAILGRSLPLESPTGRR